MPKTPEEKRAYYKEYYAKNRDILLEKQRARSKRNYSENPEIYAQRTKAWREANQERMAELQKKHYAENQDAIREYRREHYLKNKEAAANQARRSKLKRYGLTEDCYMKMAESQGHACAICKISQKDASIHGKLYVDHCHSTGLVRGLLCQHCNASLGGFKDNIEILRSAILYLTKSLSGAT